MLGAGKLERQTYLGRELEMRLGHFFGATRGRCIMSTTPFEILRALGSNPSSHIRKSLPLMRPVFSYVK